MNTLDISRIEVGIKIKINRNLEIKPILFLKLFEKYLISVTFQIKKKLMILILFLFLWKVIIFSKK